MASTMGPPPSPPRSCTQMNSSTGMVSEPENATPDECLSSMRPPPPKNPRQFEDNNSSGTISTDTSEAQPNSLQDDTGATRGPDQSSAADEHRQRQNVAVPYEIPPWSEPPCHHYFLEVLKGGSIIDQLHVYEKGAYMFGRVDLCDFMLEHPTISRFHAVLQFKQRGDAYIYDLGSTHGTFVNKKEVKKKVYEDLHVGDVIRFGQSTRLYIFQGPSELMRPEGDLKSIKKARMRDEMQDMEASLLRAKKEASLADGISWGMGEDAIEEDEEEIEEITWQTYKGQLTEKQVKTRDKLLKRLEKVANMKKEINAIRAKDISQGGLTQGQQTQIARNEQRMVQISEELENLEETLNDSIRESLGARSGKKTRGNKTGAGEDEEDIYLSDEDDFYDRTNKRSTKKKGEENQPIETADSLLDKKYILLKDMEEKNKLILEEQNRITSGNDVTDAGDELDAYMSGLSSQLVHDKTDKLQKELSELQSELDRIQYLLKIADPAGEASKRRTFTSQEAKTTISAILKHTPLKKPEEKKKLKSENTTQEQTIDGLSELSKILPEEDKAAADIEPSIKVPYTVTKPQWLGAIEDKNEKDQPQREQVPIETQESDQFVDYKDRKQVLENPDVARTNGSKPEVEGLEDAAPGLIIRKKRKKETETSTTLPSSPKKTEISAENAVALLLKHTRGYQSMEDEDCIDNTGCISGENDNKKKPKRVLGPERPQFLEPKEDYETWVPPKGQSGDGRTSLNDRYGY